MPFCRNCGKQLSDIDCYCDQCGRPTPLATIKKAEKGETEQKANDITIANAKAVQNKKSSLATQQSNERSEDRVSSTPKKIDSKPARVSGALKNCAFCGKLISSTDQRCKFCGHDMNSSYVRKKVCPVCGRHMQEDEQICKDCGHDYSKRPSHILKNIQSIIALLAGFCVVLCFLPMFSISGWYQSESISAFQMFNECLNAGDSYGSIAVFSILIIILPAVIAIINGFAMNEYKCQGCSIASTILGAFQVFSLYQLNEELGQHANFMISVNGTAAHSLYSLACIAIAILSVICIFLKR